jgi:hypothetical protein
MEIRDTLPKTTSGVKGPYGLPLMRMENEGEVMQIQIQLIHVGWKPNLAKMANRKFHFIRSNAFSMSILIAIRPPRPFFFLVSVEKFMSKNGVTLDISRRDKSRLERGDEIM